MVEKGKLAREASEVYFGSEIFGFLSSVVEIWDLVCVDENNSSV